MDLYAYTLANFTNFLNKSDKLALASNQKFLLKFDYFRKTSISKRYDLNLA